MSTNSGWLIEHNDYHTAHRWIRAIVQDNYGPGTRVHLIFDEDALVGLRFAREEDAMAFIYLHPAECLNCRPTEHQFVGL